MHSCVDPSIKEMANQTYLKFKSSNVNNNSVQKYMEKNNAKFMERYSDFPQYPTFEKHGKKIGFGSIGWGVNNPRLK